MHCPFQIVSLSELELMIDQECEEVARLLGFSVEEVALLLRVFDWDKEKLYVKYFDEPEFFLKKAGIIAMNSISNVGEPKTTQAQPQKSTKSDHQVAEINDNAIVNGTDSGSVFCSICLENVPYDATFALACNHRFCRECYGSHIDSIVSNYGDQILSKCCCLQAGCNLLLNSKQIKELATREASYQRYRYFFIKSYVQHNRQYTFCPSECGKAVRLVSDLGNTTDVVECPCGKKFCFACGLEYHNPVSCQQLRFWNKERNEDQSSLDLIMAISKPCPSCGIAIDRTDGCNHITCRKCNHQWCWQCRGPWEMHGERTGGFYYCNQYETSEAVKFDEEADRKRQSHHHFLHYFNGFHVNDKAEKDIVEMKNTFIEKGKAYRELTGGDPAFLSDALETLIQSRHVIKNSYIYGFLIPQTGDSRIKQVFELQQGYAQNICELLSNQLLMPVDQLDRSKIVNLHRVCKQYFRNLVDFFESEDGRALFTVGKAEVDDSKNEKKTKREQTAYWICESCTFANDYNAIKCTMCNHVRTHL